MGDAVLCLTLHLSVGLLEALWLEHRVPPKVSPPTWRIDNLARRPALKYRYFLSITCGKLSDNYRPTYRLIIIQIIPSEYPNIQTALADLSSQSDISLGNPSGPRLLRNHLI